jgi:hypothetical protein
MWRTTPCDARAAHRPRFLSRVSFDSELSVAIDCGVAATPRDSAIMVASSLVPSAALEE